MGSSGFSHSRRAFLWLAAGAAARGYAGRSDFADPMFARVPFREWLASGDHADLHWAARVSGSELSNQQRLSVRIAVRIDGQELAARQEHGELILLIQFTDENGVAYETHKAFQLRKLKERWNPPDVEYTQDVFVRPGDYDVALAVFDKATLDYSITQKNIHVSPLKHDPLPGSWRDLPPVQFVADTDPPDVWFLPSAPGRLYLPLQMEGGSRLTVLVNLSASERSSRFTSSSRRNLETLIPAVRVLSQIAVEGGSVNLLLADLERRRICFRQEAVRDLDWPELKHCLSTANPNVIDVRSLQHQSRDAQFFVRTVRHLVAGAADSALIVLSAPMIFSRGVDLHPLRIDGPSGCRVFYIRYYSWRQRPLAAPFFEPPGPVRGPGFAPMSLGLRPQLDELEHTLSPLKPRLFDVVTPEQFRKALGTILRDLSGA